MKINVLLQNIKTALKSIPFFYNLNARYKEWLLHRDFKQLHERYDLSYEPDLEKLSKKLKLKSEARHIQNRRLKVLWVGACYEQDNSGFLQALEKAAEVIYFTRENGVYGLEPPRDRRGLIYDRERSINGKRLKELYELHGGDEKIDLVIGQMWSTLMDPKVLALIKDAGTLVVNIAMDDKLPVHWKRDKSGRLAGSVGLGPSVDLTLNTYKNAVPMYAQHESACIYWPLASNSDVFKASPKKKYDVVFVGSNYGYRGQVIDKIKKSGINITAFGPGFPSGMLTAEQSAEVFSQSKIILGMGFISYSRKLSTLKLRDFDALFTGAMYITSRNSDLEELFLEDKHIAYYDSVEDLISKINKYLDNDELRESVALNAQNLVKLEHSWEKRINDLLSFIGLKNDKE